MHFTNCQTTSLLQFLKSPLKVSKAIYKPNLSGKFKGFDHVVELKLDCDLNNFQTDSKTCFLLKKEKKHEQNARMFRMLEIHSKLKFMKC